MTLLSSQEEKAKRGKERIIWSQRFMKRSYHQLQFLESQQKPHIVMSQHIEPKMAGICIGLKDKGFPVSVFNAAPYSDEDIIAALQSEGVAVISNTQDLGDKDPLILLDEEGTLLSNSGMKVQGIVTLSKKVAQIVDLDQKDNTRAGVVIYLHDAEILNTLGSSLKGGQACVMAFVDITNLQLAGCTVLVTGYTSQGQSVAAHAAALGAHVTVAEPNPILALRAVYDGHSVQNFEQISGKAEVIFITEKDEPSLNIKHLNSLPAGAMLCDATDMGSHSVFKNHLSKLGQPREVRENITEFTLENGKSLRLIASQAPVCVSGAEGKSIEVTDMHLALQIAAIQTILRAGSVEDMKVEKIPDSIQASIASAKLRDLGMSV